MGFQYSPLSLYAKQAETTVLPIFVSVPDTKNLNYFRSFIKTTIKHEIKYETLNVFLRFLRKKNYF